MWYVSMNSIIRLYAWAQLYKKEKILWASNAWPRLSMSVLMLRIEDVIILLNTHLGPSQSYTGMNNENNHQIIRCRNQRWQHAKKDGHEYGMLTYQNLFSSELVAHIFLKFPADTFELRRSQY